MKDEGVEFLELCQDLYFDDPVAFAHDVIGVEFSDQQKMVVQGMSDSGRVIVKSGHGTGKSCLQSILILWFMCTRANCRVVCTAPTSHQLRNVLWAELTKWYSRSILSTMDLFHVTKEGIYLNSKQFGRDWFGVPVSVSEADNMQGFHAEDILVIVDESSNVSEDVMEVIEGILTTDRTLLFTAGNPTKNDGLLYNLFHKYKEHYNCYTLSSEDSPHVESSWIQTMKDKYGEDSDVYRVRVQGNFPKTNANALISPEEIKAAMKRQLKVGDGHRLSIGLDVASTGGDRTAISAFLGDVEIAREVFAVEKTMVEIAVVLESLIKRYVRYSTGVDVKVDATGMGVSFSDFLEDRFRGKRILKDVNIIRVNFSSKAYYDRDSYANVVTEMFFNLRDRLPELSLLDRDEELIEEISSREFAFDSRTRFQMERKDRFCDRIGRSPDIADAILLGTFNPMNNVMKEGRLKRRG